MILAIFDLDGTILDTLQDMHECLDDTMNHFGLKRFSIDVTRSFVGDGIRRLVIRAAGEENFKDEMETYFRKLYSAKMTVNTKVIDGYDEIFKYLKNNNIKTVILSNKIASLTGGLVQHYGIDRYFDKWYGGDSFGVKKPSPVPVENIVKDYGAEKSNTIMIGDNHTDIESGFYAGVKTCFCTFGYGTVSEVKPDFTVNSPREIINILEGMK
ncbi:HAD-IA family hydrolase [Seleniivibrio sp.]|uniref:HAD family hydrolase n=1 Tax=Seleniivibrio sp. TaxID=2898801 RepID=UPI0025D758AA|nr:HAD-IA family hydrolase [Seleniivibrio sp.]MCD8553269.1 HAD-IA family hydrolase [Seleniivibrio sp.]